MTANFKRGLAVKTVRGFSLSVLASSINKVLGIVSQFTLAIFLLPEDFTLVASTMGLASFLQLFNLGSALHQKLVTKTGSILNEAIQAFYIGIISSAFVLVLTVLSLMAIVNLYPDQRIAISLILTILILPLDSLVLFESVWLTRHFRFEIINAINIAQSVLRVILQIAMALLGCGFLSIFIPNLVGCLLKVILLRFFSPRLPLAPLDLATWGRIAPATISINCNLLLLAFTQYTFILLFPSSIKASDVGLYFWAFTLSSQAAHVVSGSLSGVFLPAFVTMNRDPNRQVEAFLNSSLALSFLLAPACGLLSFFAFDIIKHLFGDSWLDAWPLVCVLALPFVNQPLVSGAQSLLMAKGRNNQLLAFNAWFALLSVLVGISSWWLPSLLHVACFHAFIIVANAFCLAKWTCGECCKLSQLLRVLLAPYLPCISAGVLCYVFFLLFERSFTAVVVNAGLYCITYIFAMWLAFPALHRTYLDRLRSTFFNRKFA